MNTPLTSPLPSAIIDPPKDAVEYPFAFGVTKELTLTLSKKGYILVTGFKPCAVNVILTLLMKGINAVERNLSPSLS